MLTDTEAAFLRERLDEDEAAARAATPGPWKFEGDDPTDDELYSVHDGEHGDLIGQTVAWTRDRNVANGQHMARHDPARALREVAVWRRILLDHQTAPLDSVYGGTERVTGFRMALSAVLKAKIATYDGNPVTGEPFPSGQARERTP